MTLTSKPLIGASLALTAAAVAVLFWAMQRGDGDVATAVAATPPQVSPSGDELFFRPGSPQLAMLRVEKLPAVPVALAEPLEARLVYNEDATARLGVPVAGRVVAIHAQAGDTVKAGQALVDIDSPDLGGAVAELDRARVDEAQRRRAAERLRELAPGDAIPARDLEQAEADLASARADRLRAEQRLRNLNPWGAPLQGQRMTLRSPIAGVVTERNVNPGMELAPGAAAPVFVVSRLDRPWVTLDVPERLLAHVRVGSPLRLESDAADTPIAARVTQIGRVVDAASRRVPVRAELDQPDARLLPEMFVRAWLSAPDGARAVRVPNTALVTRGLYAFAFVETASGRFVRRQVSFAARGSEASFVSRGLADGERVVVSGAMLLDAEMSPPAEVTPAATTAITTATTTADNSPTDATTSAATNAAATAPAAAPARKTP